MWAIEWAAHRNMTWSGQGYCDAPWLARKYASAGEAEAVAARVGGVAVPWQERPRETTAKADTGGCPF